MLFANPFEIIKRTEKLYYLKPGSLVTYNRTGLAAEARAVAMFAVRELTPYSWHDIANHFERDHTTIIHNCRKIKNIVQKGCNNRISSAILILSEEFKEGQSSLQ